MTLVDAMALVLGVALAFVAIPGRSFFMHMPAVWVLAYFGLVDLIRGLSLALSAVVLGRLARYRRMPRPSEWLSILVTASMLAGRQELNVDGFVNRLYASFPGLARSPIDFGGWRWAIAGVELVFLVVGLAASRLLRDRLAPWSKALGLAGLATLAISGPLAVFGLQGADLVTPSGGFGPGMGPILLRKSFWLLAQLPMGLLFGVPAVAALAERVEGRPWGWTEWVGASLALILGTITVIFDRNEFPIPSGGWIAEHAMTLAWLVVAFLLARMLVFRVGPGWFGETMSGPLDRSARPRIVGPSARGGETT